MAEVFKKVLSGELDPVHAKRIADSDSMSHEVFVTPTIIITMLERYISNVLDSEKLSAWAAFLVSYDVYVTKGWETDSQADRYEKMWDILQQLSTPAIDGPITIDRAKYYINQMMSIESSSSA